MSSTAVLWRSRTATAPVLRASLSCAAMARVVRPVLWAIGVMLLAAMPSTAGLDAGPSPALSPAAGSHPTEHPSPSNIVAAGPQRAIVDAAVGCDRTDVRSRQVHVAILPVDGTGGPVEVSTPVDERAPGLIGGATTTACSRAPPFA